MILIWTSKFSKKFTWLDRTIENENLHRAVKSLLTQYQVFISYIAKECKT